MKLLTIASIAILITVLLLTGLMWVVRTVGADDVMTWDEYQEYISMLNYEILKMGGMVTLQNVSGENGFTNAFHAKIRSREVKGSVNMGGKSFTKNQYSNRREALMKKAEL